MKKVTGSIKAQLTIITVLLVAIPLLVSVVISAVSMMNEGIQNAKNMNETEGALIEESIANVISTNLTTLESFASSPTTARFIEGSSDEGIEEELFA